MTRYDASSRCSGPGAPAFRWYGFPACEVGADVEAAVSKLMAVISSEGRVWNPWSGTIVRREFRSRILRASKGELLPVDEVKPVDINQPPPMYEIRWQDVDVAELLPDGSQRFAKVVVRMYHSEPTGVPDYFIGHHAHEKDLDADDINAAQDEEIRTALGWYQHGFESGWGIARGSSEI